MDPVAIAADPETGASAPIFQTGPDTGTLQIPGKQKPVQIKLNQKNPYQGVSNIPVAPQPKQPSAGLAGAVQNWMAQKNKQQPQPGAQQIAAPAGVASAAPQGAPAAAPAIDPLSPEGQLAQDNAVVEKDRAEKEAFNKKYEAELMAPAAAYEAPKRDNFTKGSLGASSIGLLLTALLAGRNANTQAVGNALTGGFSSYLKGREDDYNRRVTEAEKTYNTQSIQQEKRLANEALYGKQIEGRLTADQNKSAKDEVANNVFLRNRTYAESVANTADWRDKQTKITQLRDAHNFAVGMARVNATETDTRIMANVRQGIAMAQIAGQQNLALLKDKLASRRGGGAAALNQQIKQFTDTANKIGSETEAQVKRVQDGVASGNITQDDAKTQIHNITLLAQNSFKNLSDGAPAPIKGRLAPFMQNSVFEINSAAQAGGQTPNYQYTQQGFGQAQAPAQPASVNVGSPNVTVDNGGGMEAMANAVHELVSHIPGVGGNHPAASSLATPAEVLTASKQYGKQAAYDWLIKRGASPEDAANYVMQATVGVKDPVAKAPPSSQGNPAHPSSNPKPPSTSTLVNKAVPHIKAKPQHAMTEAERKAQLNPGANVSNALGLPQGPGGWQGPDVELPGQGY